MKAALLNDCVLYDSHFYEKPEEKKLETPLKALEGLWQKGLNMQRGTVFKYHNAWHLRFYDVRFENGQRVTNGSQKLQI